MSTAAERRRRLGKAAVDAAHRAAKDAPPPGRSLFDALSVLLAGHSRARTGGDPDGPSRDAA